MNNEKIIIDAGVKLKIVDSSLENMQKILNNLKPDTAAYSSFFKLFEKMQKKAEDLRTAMSQPIVNKKQLTDMEKMASALAQDLTRVGLNYNKLKTSDFIVDDGGIDKIKELEEALESTQKKIRDEFLATDIGKNFLSINPDVATKSLDEINEIVGQKLEEITAKLKRFDANKKKMDNALNLEQKVKNIQQKGLNLETLGGTFAGFLSKDGTKFKSRINQDEKNSFFEQLKKELTLTPTQMKMLESVRNASLEKISQIMSAEGFWDSKQKTFDTGHKLAASGQYTEEIRKELEAEQAALEGTSTGLEGFIARANQALSKHNAQVKIVQDEYGQMRIESAKTSADISGNSEKMRSAIEGLKQELEGASAAFQKIERTRRTFQSIKMAITNFMGFYQTINLVKKAVTDAYNHIKTLDNAMNAIAVVSKDLTTADLWGQVDKYSAAAQKYGVSIEGAYEVSKIYYQAGYDTSEVMTLMNETLKLAQISGLDYATTTDYMMTA